MILSKQKPLEEILGYLEGESKIFILGCNGCAQASGTGGPVQVAEMKGKLEAAGKKVDDAVDDVSDGVKDAADDLKKN